MVTTTQVKYGLAKYIDSEIMPKMTGVKKLGLGVYTALAADNLEAAVLKYRTTPAIAILGVIDEDGNVDMDKLYSAATRHFDGGAKVSVEVPILGIMTFSRQDLDKLYQMIVGG